ncbi:MAG: hypothetical protein ACR2PA_07490 [Hyphomicrobiaceae bacterium]
MTVILEIHEGEENEIIATELAEFVPSVGEEIVVSTVSGTVGQTLSIDYVVERVQYVVNTDTSVPSDRVMLFVKRAGS